MPPVIALLTILGCGGSGGGEPVEVVVAGPPKSAAFLKAEQACGQEAFEPEVQWVRTVPCGEPGFFCCIAPDRASEYDTDTNTIRLAGAPECRHYMLNRNLPCEYENAVSWQNGEQIDRCYHPCGR